MPIYHTLGEIPKKRHIAFRKPDGGIYAEELMGHEGFTGTSSLLYHIHPPTTVKSVRRIKEMKLEADPDKTDDFFYRNAQADELIYVSQGSGVLDTIYGELPFSSGDYLIIHRGILH